MNKEKLGSQAQLLVRLSRLEKAVFGVKGTKPVKAVSVSKRRALPDYILELRDSGFLDLARTPTEVHAALKPKYPCDLDRVKVALLRLQRRRQLRKSSKTVGNKKMAAYVR